MTTNSLDSDTDSSAEEMAPATAIAIRKNDIHRLDDAMVFLDLSTQ